MHKQKTAIVIGAGFGGLSAAALLAKQGYKVTVLEKNEGVGGRGSILKESGYEFDMGPSWYLMPDIFEDFFAIFNKKPSDYYDLQRLDPSYRVFTGGKSFLDISADLETNKKLFDTLEPDGGSKLQTYLNDAKFKYEISKAEFLYKSYNHIWDFINWRLIKDGSKLNIFENLSKFVSKHFESETVRKIIQYTAVFLGVNPAKTPSVYSLMTHIDFNLGVWYPIGGIYAVAKAIESLGSELGVEYKFNTPVEKLVVENGNIVSVVTNNEQFIADIIIANADYPFVETQLLPKEYQSYEESYWEKAGIAPSALIFYIGLDKKLDGLTHHNLFLQHDWKSHADKVFDDPSWPKDPSYYVSCPSKTDPTVAPPDKDLLFILIPVASGIEDTQEIRDKYYDWIITDIENTIGQSIKDHIVYKKDFAHKDFSSRYNAYKGNALGLGHTLRQTAYFRPKQKSKKVKNLYFTGQYTIPGVGVPMTLISSIVLNNELEKLNK